MSMMGWVDLGFVWLMVSFVIAGIVMWTWQIRSPMQLKWKHYDKDGTYEYGFIAWFVFVWAGLFIAGCTVVNIIRFLHLLSTVFSWLDTRLTDAG